MGKATPKAIALSALMALFGKAGKAQEMQTVMPKQAVKEKTVTDSVPNNKGKIVQFSDAKNWLHIEPQFFCYLDAPHGAKFVGTSVFAVRPSMDFFNKKVSAGLTSTAWLSNYGAKTIEPAVFDFYGHADVKVGNGKSIEAKYGNFSAVNYCDDVSRHMPSRVEYVDRIDLKSGFYFPMAAMVSFHDKHYSAGVGLSSSTPHKWQGDRNVFVAGEYDVFGDDDEWKVKVGGVFSYNIGTFDGENQIGNKFKDRISGTLQLVVDAPGVCSALYEITGFGAQNELSFHVLWYYDEKLIVPNLALSFDFLGKLKYNEGVLGPYDERFDAEKLECALTVWYPKLGAYVSAGLGSTGSVEEICGQNSDFGIKDMFSIETGIRIPLSKLIQDYLKRGKQK